VKRSTKRIAIRWVLAVVIVAAGAGVAWKYWLGAVGKPPGARRPDIKAPRDANAGGDANAVPPARARDANTAAGREAKTQPAGDEATPQKLAISDGVIQQLRKLDAAAANAALATGRQLLADNKPAEGRAELSKALLSGKLPPAEADALRKTLADLADQLTFSRRIYDADPYATQYAFAAGELLRNVERKLKLHVPTQLLLKINDMTDARRIRSGQTFKMIHGPFHAVVSKGSFTMDLYLHREGCEPAFIKRLRVGLGKNGSTPNGLWQVKLGSKHERANWNPPPNSPVKRSIRWGEPDYPLGKRGYWIGLEGINGNTALHEGYGIHGTNSPQSIGREESLGCIRLADPDIELVYYLLYEYWSTVRVEP
jgi:lipoprotein-anchoring transpeptidase ErfK/SrfK